MVIIKINRKRPQTVIAIVLAAFLGFGVYSYIQNMELENKYKSLIYITGQFDNTNLISFLVSVNASVHGYKNIEIFDISKGEVIKKVQSNPEIQKEARSYLEGITGMYIKVKAFPDKGYIIRIPIEPPFEAKNQWLNDYGINSVEEVFILFPEEGMPYLLVLDGKYRPLFYNFDGNTDLLLKNLSFKPDAFPSVSL